jgi:hypothetical protein
MTRRQRPARWFEYQLLLHVRSSMGSDHRAMNRANDRALAPTGAQRSVSGRLLGRVRNQVLTAAGHDIGLTERLMRVTNLVDPPTRLRDPALLARALVGNLRRRVRAAR